MSMGEFPPTQLYASLAFVLSVATLWINRLKDDAQAWEFMRGGNGIAVNAAVCAFLTLPILHVLYTLFVHSNANVWHQLVHAAPLIAAMLAIIGWWMRTLAVTPTVVEEAEAPA